jgi:hypothetical protein
MKKSICLILAIFPIYYYTLNLILGQMWNGYNPISQSMSEIGAVDSPYRHQMNFLGFSMIGVSFLIFAYLYHLEFKASLLRNLSLTFIITAGVSMFLVGFLPCDVGCINETSTGYLHSITATIPAILMPIAAILSAQVITLKWNKQWGLFSFIIGVLSLLSGPIMFLSQSLQYLGLIQRIGMGLSMMWVSAISFKIYKETSLKDSKI